MLRECGMAFQAKYIPREDRMRVTLRPPEGDVRSFWVTRRQWLDVLHELDELGEAQGEPREEVPQPPEERRKRAMEPVPEPIALQSLRLQRSERGAKLLFATGGGRGASFNLPQPALPRLRQLFQQQAEQAGWDPAAALDRLGALDLAGEVVRKAKGSS